MIPKYDSVRLATVVMAILGFALIENQALAADAINESKQYNLELPEIIERYLAAFQGERVIFFI